MPNRSDRPIVEASLESVEVVADVLTRGDVLAEIPVFGTAIKICRAADAIRDRAFAVKLAKFVQNLDAISDEQKQKIRRKISDEREEIEKLSETLIFVIERLTDLDKPKLLAQLFVAYIDEVLSGDDLRRLAQAVDAAFGDDLKKLLSLHKVPKKSDDQWMQYLVPSGLTRLVAGQTFDELGKIYFEITPIGNKLRTAYFHGRKEMGKTA